MLLPDPETCARLARDVAPRWVWMPGMLAVDTAGRRWRIRLMSGSQVADLEGNTFGFAADWPGYANGNALPDLRDPLTAAGALLVARVVWNDPTIYAMQALRTRDDSWVVRNSAGTPYQTLRRCLRDDPYYPTELEALIAAILAAPEKP